MRFRYGGATSPPPLLVALLALQPLAPLLPVPLLLQPPLNQHRLLRRCLQLPPAPALRAHASDAGIYERRQRGAPLLHLLHPREGIKTEGQPDVEVMYPVGGLQLQPGRKAGSVNVPADSWGGVPDQEPESKARIHPPASSRTPAAAPSRCAPRAAGRAGWRRARRGRGAHTRWQR